MLAGALFISRTVRHMDALREGMVYEPVRVEPQPVITGTMDGNCYLSRIEAGGHAWREQFNRYRASPVTGRLVVADLGASWATARFEATDSAESGTFVTTWDEGFYPSSDPCGY